MAAILFRAVRHRAPPHLNSSVWLALVALNLAPIVAAAAIWSRALALQLLARAYWWAQLLFAALIVVTGTADNRVAALAAVSAFALLTAGRIGLDEDSGGRFRPVAFRGTLMLALVLAIADAGSLSWLGILQTFDEGRLGLILFAPPMIAAVIGLLRLRTWGLLVSVVSNLLLAVLAGAQLLHLPEELRRLFIGTAIAQLLIPVPMWVTIIRRRTPLPDRWRRARVVASTSVILVLATVCVAGTLARTIGRVPYVAP